MSLLDKFRKRGLTFPLPADRIPHSPSNDAQAYGVLIKPASVRPGETYWQAVLVHHLTPEENRGHHHIFVEVLDEEGQRVEDVEILIKNGGTHILKVNPSPQKPALAFPMKGWDMYEVSIAGMPADRVLNLTAALPAEGKGTPEGHHSFLIIWRRTRAAEEIEAPPVTEAAPAEVPAPEPASTVEAPPSSPPSPPQAPEPIHAEAEPPAVEPVPEEKPTESGHEEIREEEERPTLQPAEPEPLPATPSGIEEDKEPKRGEPEILAEPPAADITSPPEIRKPEEETPPETAPSVEPPVEATIPPPDEKKAGEEMPIQEPSTVEDYRIAEAEMPVLLEEKPTPPTTPETFPFTEEIRAFDTYVLFALRAESALRGYFYALVDELVHAKVPFGFGAVDAAGHYKRVIVIGHLSEEDQKYLERAGVETIVLEGDEDTIGDRLTTLLSVG